MKETKEHGLLNKIASWCLKSKNMVHAIGHSFLKVVVYNCFFCYNVLLIYVSFRMSLYLVTYPD